MRAYVANSAAPPTEAIAVPANQLGGLVGRPGSLGGIIPSWHMLYDEEEETPELSWPNSVKTYHRMRSDSQLDALYEGISLPVRRRRWVIDPNGAPARMVNAIATDFNLPIKGQQLKSRGRYKRRFIHDRHQKDALLARIYGHYFFQQLGDVGSDGRWRLRKLIPIPPHTIAGVEIADDGGLVALHQFNSRGGALQPLQAIPVDYLVGYVWDMEGANWFGRSMFRSCFRNWLSKDKLYRIDVVNHEKAGGYPVPEAAPGALPHEIEKLEEAARKFRVGELSGVAVPSGTKWNQIRASGSDVISSAREHDAQMSRRFLMMFIGLGQQTHVGSYALSHDFVQFFAEAIDAHCNWYADTFNEHVIEDYVDWNYGVDTDPVPLLTFEESDPVLDFNALAQMIADGVVLVDDELEQIARDHLKIPQRDPSLPLRTPTAAPAAAGTSKGVGGTSNQEAATLSSGRAAAARPERPVAARAALAASSAPSSERRPDRVACSQLAVEPAVIRVNNVPLVSVGMDWKASTGTHTFTIEDLSDAALAESDPTIPTSRLVPGHTDPRWNACPACGEQHLIDGDPSLGSVVNLKFNQEDLTLYGDYVKVPAWIGPYLPYLYPSRSIEGAYDVEAVSGKNYHFVLTDVKLLGLMQPAIGTLADLPAWYGEELPVGWELSPEVQAAMLAAGQGGAEMKVAAKAATVAASVDTDNIRRLFYDEIAQGDQYWWWIRAMEADSGDLIVDDDEGQLYQLTFSTSGDQVTFGDPAPVKIEYVPVTVDKKVAASAFAAGMVAGKTNVTVYASRAASRFGVATQEGGSVDGVQLRKDLGLPDTASDAEVSARVAELRSAGAGGILPAAAASAGAEGGAEGSAGEGAPPPAHPGGGVENPDGDDDESAGGEGAAAPAATPDVEAGKVVQVDASVWNETKRGAALAIEQHRLGREREINEIALGAAKARKIPFAHMDHYKTMLTANFDGTKKLLEELQEGVVPPNEPLVAVDGDAAMGAASQVGGLPEAWFPDAARNRAQVAASSGQIQGQLPAGKGV